jgi:hypothetical protein
MVRSGIQNVSVLCPPQKTRFAEDLPGEESFTARSFQGRADDLFHAMERRDRCFVDGKGLMSRYSRSKRPNRR